MPLRGLFYAIIFWMVCFAVLALIGRLIERWKMGTHCDACGQPSTPYIRLTKVGRSTLCPDCRLDAEGEARESQE